MEISQTITVTGRVHGPSVLLLELYQQTPCSLPCLEHTCTHARTLTHTHTHTHKTKRERGEGVSSYEDSHGHKTVWIVTTTKKEKGGCVKFVKTVPDVRLYGSIQPPANRKRVQNEMMLGLCVCRERHD